MKVAIESIIIGKAVTCSGCMPGCNSITSSADVKGTVPFEMGGIATLKTLILLMHVAMTVGSSVRAIRSLRWTRKESGEDYYLNLLRFLDLLM
jgi:hypothetical protein